MKPKAGEVRIQVRGTRPLRKHLDKIYAQPCLSSRVHMSSSSSAWRSVPPAAPELLEQYFADSSFHPWVDFRWLQCQEVPRRSSRWRMTFCLKAELVFAETRCHLIDDRASLPPWGGLLSGSGSPTSPQGVRLSPRLQYIEIHCNTLQCIAIHCALATVYRT